MDRPLRVRTATRSLLSSSSNPGSSFFPKYTVGIALSPHFHVLTGNQSTQTQLPPNAQISRPKKQSEAALLGSAGSACCVPGTARILKGAMSQSYPLL
jgi:hypothetical protein